MTNRPPEIAVSVEQEEFADEHRAGELEQKARQLAGQHRLKQNFKTAPVLLDRLTEQEALLLAGYQHFRQNAEEITVSYAAEWVLDNFYIIQQALRQIEEDLPEGYYRRLPKLDSGSIFEDLPRVYELAHEIVLHDRCQLDFGWIEQFLSHYQAATPLRMGEIWALPIMLRFAILESLTQAVTRLTEIEGLATTPPPALQFSHDLADADIVANCILSLRTLANHNWKRFFEDVSLVEQILRQDPAGIYVWMDFETRDQYRSVVEEIAWTTQQDEVKVAQAAIQLAQAHSTGNIPEASLSINNKKEWTWEGLELPRTSHVGFYLIGNGHDELEKRFGYRPVGLKRLHRMMLARPTLFYLGTISLVTLLVLLAVLSYTLLNNGTPLQLVAVALFTLIPAVTIAVNLINWVTTNSLPPRILPKLNFEEGIPDTCRTMVVIPALLTFPDDISSLLSELELHYLRNPDPHLTFALLTDFSDAPQAQMPEDEELLQQIQREIQDYNRRYQHHPFYLFHRRRLWNASEGVWMGWERKRGKLHEFNQLLRGEQNHSYVVQVGDLTILPQIRYVITLDADTVLPRDSAQRLVATLAHPLNQAQFDPETGEIVAGYTILQPRTEITPVSANQSLFTRIFAGDTGLDLYTLAVSDVYQDLFGEGIYIGKGIYDVDAFERSLAGRVPENALLSHDLFEGIHGRVGLVTDVILYEDYPPHYLVHIQRSHRWIRGDWQLLPWLLPRVPHAVKHKAASTLSAVDRWKIIDNLRRSLLPPALLFLFLAGWTRLPGSPLFWTLLGLLTPAGPFITTAIDSTVQLLSGSSWGEIRQSLRDSLLRWLLAIAFLPYETVLTLDAIFLTLVRLFFTRRNLLQWRTVASTARLFGQQIRLQATRQQMIYAVLVSGSLALLVYLTNPAALPFAFPLLVIWLFSPEIAYWISQPLDFRRGQLTESQRQQLRTLARRTWFFFEQFAGPHDNWLPPDHFQETPRGVVAHRTSPTNIGLLLLSTLTAYDMGYIDSMELALRLRASFDTLQKLERYRGHFLNWLDTQTLAPLPPRYVSTVDSGNLAACFLALKQGCREIMHHQLWRWERWQGFLDTLALLTEMITEVEAGELDEAANAVRKQIALIDQDIQAVRSEPQQWPWLLRRLRHEDIPRLDQHLVEWAEAEARDVGAERLRNLRRYTERIHHHLQSMQRERDLLLPWVSALDQPPALFTQADIDPDIREAWQTIVTTLSTSPVINEIDAIYRAGQEQLRHLRDLLQGETDLFQEARAWCKDLANELSSAQIRAKALLISFEQIGREAETYFQEMDFRFLFNQQRQVFHIGYNLDNGTLDRNYYDLLASEARIASIVAIAKNEIPQSHWLHLSRPLTHLVEGQALLSWSGTMFEYLMPLLLMRNYEGTLLHQSVYSAVNYQIAYGRQHNVPWGISESGYYAFDASMNYQYRAFGAPALGFKRGLADDLVITPYASLLAVSLRPQAVVDNLENLAQQRMLGRYGFYEAIDYTSARLALGQEKAIVASYMAHHQGMILLALANYLQNETMVQRFHTEPRIQAVDLLLQERIPQQAPAETPIEEEVSSVQPAQTATPVVPWELLVNTPMPQVHYLSNGRYHLLLSNAGTGFSHWQEVNLTRWRADTTLDEWGSWLYVQDEETGNFWSAGYQPTAMPARNQTVTFHPHMVELRRHTDEIALHMEVTVAPDDDVEIRALTMTNESNRLRRLRLVSYGEVVLAPQGADERHPAFVKLFVQSEYLPKHNALLFRRRPRSAEEESVYLAHLLMVEQGQEVTGAYESSRVRFLGRGRTPRAPIVMENKTELSGSTGATLDPIFSLGQTVALEPHASVKLVYLTLAAKTRREALEIAERYRRWSFVDQAFTQARTRSERELRQLGFSTSALEQTQQLLSLLLYPHPVRRAEPATLAANQKGQSGLWAYGISGDYPILLVQLNQEEGLSLVQELLRAHTYWRSRQLKIDLVILNQEESGYQQTMQGDLMRLVHQMDSDNWLNQRGGIFVLRTDQMSEADIILLRTSARVDLDGDKVSLSQQLAGLYQEVTRLPLHVPVLTGAETEEPTPALPRPDNLQFNNGPGGFSPDGHEYMVYLHPGETTPAPWINVIANETFGFLVSESGIGSTWAVNSGENRLSSWRNDPVTDLPGEVLYLRDEETAEIWSPTPQPAPAPAPYLIRHGAGYTIFEHHSHGLRQQLRLFAVPDAPLKVVQVRIENKWKRPRRLTATYYVEWVLGTNRETTQQYIIPEYDREHQALLARNPYNTEFEGRVAFLAANKEPHSLTADRTEFLGRLGSLREPAGLKRIGLEGRVEAGVDPCAVLQLHLDLGPGEHKEIHFLVGQGASREESLSLIQQYQDPDRIKRAWLAAQELWEDVLGAVQVDTPDPAMNILLNRWLLYQALACRIWGRSALYQSSGAYGFRDQLQDVLSLLHTRPDLARDQILRAARYQFIEGDVLHWWHPPSGRGVRTRIKDDLLWLPYVTAHYLAATGDETILEEEVPFLKGEPLKEDEEERYGHYGATQELYSLYEHCRRVLQKGDTKGPHDLPLMGGGDWNDGMNRVGIEGRGESIWLGWFLYATLMQFAGLCDRIGKQEQAEIYRRRARELSEAIETHGWDGAWYRRAYYDDGTPLGSAQNKECQIDAIAQSWGVMSGAADPERANQALKAVLERLVKWDERLLLLFTPPLDKTPRDPGYIKGYLPGIRENGGQYTHAALWTIWAFAELGEGDRAEALFRLINPIYRADTPEKVARYQVEPYVISADVYSVPPHTGRGGWTWYTGSSGWMYRLGIEAILGLRREGEKLRLDPCIPKDWPGYSLTYRFGKTCYQIQVENPAGVQRGVKQVQLDGRDLSCGAIPLKDDQQRHNIRITLGELD